MKFKIFTSVFLFLGMSLSGEVLGTISYMKGTVTLERDGKKVDKIKIGTSVMDDDQITTAANSEAEITLKASSGTPAVIKMKEQTLVILDISSKSKVNGIELLTGAVSLKVQKLSNSQLQVRTDTLVCGVRGTEFEVAYGIGGENLVATYEGSVDAQFSDQDAFLVKAGQAWDEDGEGIWQSRSFKSAEKTKISTYWRQEKELGFKENFEKGLQRFESRSKSIAEKIDANLAKEESELDDKSAKELRKSKIDTIRFEARANVLKQFMGDNKLEDREINGKPAKKLFDDLGEKRFEREKFLDKARGAERKFMDKNGGFRPPLGEFRGPPPNNFAPKNIGPKGQDGKSFGPPNGQPLFPPNGGLNPQPAPSGSAPPPGTSPVGPKPSGASATPPGGSPAPIKK